ncbi:CitMHS family transporter [Macrococcus equipercicus]|uniref:CitMHS family transporter n=1 Tax=Macrococcus equipercicus TaxID=69967 RepID=A0A9Q9BJG5_9STAP|nr:CitMHS family transporter [Macrococcus equipercicus]UTH12753.1 CitMHS family transporter [Macrococcus equipercicus]
MNLALLGFIMIVVFMALIMSKKMSALVALILVPTVFAIIGGFYNGIGEHMLEGLKQVAPTGMMLIFAILYFGIMIDAGLFDPVINVIIKAVKGDPLKITIGTVILASLVALDGDGTTTFIITVTAMLPLYRKVGMNPYILAALALLSIGVMNMTPWGGPTARAISALQTTTEEVFTPIIPVMAAGILFALGVAYYFGVKERKRVGIADHLMMSLDDMHLHPDGKSNDENALLRPKLVWVNALLTILLLYALITEFLPIPVLFMCGFAVAVLINYPNIALQSERIKAHAPNVLAVVSLVFASGIFTGVMNGTKMVDAMATALVNIVPASMGDHFAVITALLSMPFTYFMANDPYYYGILPILAESASQFGITKAEMARASILGQPVHVLSPLYAAGYLLVGMLGIDYGENQKFALKWAIGSSVFMIVVAIILGVIPL